MKITQVMVGEQGGGVERIAPDMSLTLAEAGHQVQLILHKNFSLPDGFEHPNVSVFKVGLRHRRDFLARLKIKRALRRFGPDVAHLHLRQGVTLANGVCRRLNIPTLTSMHNYGNPGAYNQVDKLLVPTHALHTFLIDSGIAAEKIAYVPNFSRMPLAPVPASLASPVRFFSFGRFVEKKGFSSLISAVDLIRQRGHRVKVDIAGQGPLDEALAEQIKQHNLQDFVSLLPWQKDPQAFIDTHDVFILPSLDEPFGLVLLEASARGKPVITSMTAGPREIFDDDSAYWFDIGNAEQLAAQMLEVINDPVASLQKARNAQQVYVDKYSHRQFAEEIQQVYRQTVSADSQ